MDPSQQQEAADALASVQQQEEADEAMGDMDEGGWPVQQQVDDGEVQFVGTLFGPPPWVVDVVPLAFVEALEHPQALAAAECRDGIYVSRAVFDSLMAGATPGEVVAVQLSGARAGGPPSTGGAVGAVVMGLHSLGDTVVAAPSTLLDVLSTGAALLLAAGTGTGPGPGPGTTGASGAGVPALLQRIHPPLATLLRLRPDTCALQWEEDPVEALTAALSDMTCVVQGQRLRLALPGGSGDLWVTVEAVEPEEGGPVLLRGVRVDVDLLEAVEAVAQAAADAEEAEAVAQVAAAQVAEEAFAQAHAAFAAQEVAQAQMTAGQVLGGEAGGGTAAPLSRAERASRAAAAAAARRAPSTS